MKNIMTGVAALVLGLLFCCIKVEACDEILPDAGFSEFLHEIEVDPKMPSYILTDEDATMLLQIGVLEAGGSDADAIANVMQVVLNRFESDKFPNSISGVIFQDKQFCTAKRLANAVITPEAYVALDAVVFGEYKSNEGLYFESLDGMVWAKCHTYLFSYGGHDFYK